MHTWDVCNMVDLLLVYVCTCDLSIWLDHFFLFLDKGKSLTTLYCKIIFAKSPDRSGAPAHKDRNYCIDFVHIEM